jgi:hypothetical protein
MPERGQRATEELLDQCRKVGVRRLLNVERERFLVLMGVADGETTAEALHAGATACSAGLRWRTRSGSRSSNPRWEASVRSR